MKNEYFIIAVKRLHDYQEFILFKEIINWYEIYYTIHHFIHVDTVLFLNGIKYNTTDNFYNSDTIKKSTPLNLNIVNQIKDKFIFDGKIKYDTFEH